MTSYKNPTHKPPTTPYKGPESRHAPGNSYVSDTGEIFKVGVEGTDDISLGEDGRLFAWRSSPSDLKAAKHMGWSDYAKNKYTGFNEEVLNRIGPKEHMMIPGDMRNAASILGGTKAWDTEKVEIFATVAGRLGDLWRETGMYPSEFSWDSVGVTTKDDRKIVIMPPGNLEVVQDMETLQQSNAEIVDSFRSLLSEQSNYHVVTAESFHEKFLTETHEQ